MFSTFCLAICVVVCSPLNSKAIKAKLDPKLSSLFPLGGRSGSTFEVTIRGENLEGVFGVWFDCKALQAEVKRIEKIQSNQEEDGYKTGKKKSEKRLYQVLVKVNVDSEVAIGIHGLRLI